jgi:anthranilate synthase component 2
MTCTRYHSLIVAEDGLPRELEITARTEDGIIMGLRHRKYPVEGVQFHPESVLTHDGKRLIQNFLQM